MIEVKIPGIRHGMAYVAGAYAKGSFVQKDGVFSQSDIDGLPTGQKSKPGYASVGDNKLTQVTSAAAGQRGLVFPINKLVFKPEDSDSDLDTIAAGASCIFYQGGQYETDQYTSVSGTGGVYNDNLEIGASGKLVESAEADTSTQVVAKVIKLTLSDSYVDDVLTITDQYDKDRLWFELL